MGRQLWRRDSAAGFDQVNDAIGRPSASHSLLLMSRMPQRGQKDLPSKMEILIRQVPPSDGFLRPLDASWHLRVNQDDHR
ncbi:Hypothetical protein NTJ_08760 [Nesidiocoris tenuis]|uniref:Uncharacterized protein n=1 Tax=Nesidiocoris tenuis TaxID=355587 RepID=A0ABN7AUT5_9HEMI|nr:Hypothetical protein NTJ_08760 [Nesidiocoris tenuis]